MEADEAIETLTPPPPAHDGEPQPSVEDPTASGYYCGAQRSHRQIAQAVENGDSPWPWCRMRAGRGTTHVGTGRCSFHLGSTVNHRRSAMLRYAELHGPAVETFARALVDEACPWPSKIRAAENIEDRAGYPRRMEIDTDVGRLRLHERILQFQSEQTEEDDDG